MVEGSNIDKAAHHGKLAEMMEEIFDFDRTAGTVLEWAARHPGTLVVITADHNTGAFSLSGGNLEKGEITALFSSGNHDGVAVPVYAFGSGSGAFTGIYENTDIFRKIMGGHERGGKQGCSRQKRLLSSLPSSCCPLCFALPWRRIHVPRHQAGLRP